MFKQAILQNPDELTIIGDGKNLIPMIHVDDLCRIVEQIAFGRSDNNYHLLSDESETTQYELVKTIADAVGNGKVKLVPREDGLHDPNYHLMTLDFQVADKTQLKTWTAQTGFAKNITNVVSEFNSYRGIKANKIFISGMPLAGKSHAGAMYYLW